MRTDPRADTQDIIIADRHDDLGSLRAKLESTEAVEVFLVLPRDAGVLRSVLDFRVLARMLQSLASDVVIVTGDGERRRRARMAGLRTRRSLRGLLHLLPPDQAERFRFRWYRFWRWLPLLKLLVVFLPLLGVLLVAAAFLVLLPELRVTLSPATDVDSVLLDLRVDQNLTAPDAVAKRLPGRPLNQQFEVEAQVAASGRGRRPGQTAMGAVTFVNSRDQLLIVPPGHIVVATNGVRFTTDDEVRLPPNTLVGVRVGVHAVQPGPSGNVPAMAITRPLEPGPAGMGLFNERPTEGGSEEVYPEVVEQDFIVLRQQLFQRANDEAWGQLATLTRDEWSIVPDTVRVQTEQETFSHGLHAVSPDLTGRLVARVTGLAYENAGFNRLAEVAWAVSLPAGFKPLGGTVDLTVPEYLGLDGEGPLYRVGVRGRIIRELDAGALAARLRGATLAEARAALSTRDGLSAPAQIEIWPDWAPRAFRLQVFQVRTE
jgi:hypothetical protein